MNGSNHIQQPLLDDSYSITRKNPPLRINSDDPEKTNISVVSVVHYNENIEVPEYNFLIEEDDKPKKKISKDGLPKSPIERYNCFVGQYNLEYNQAVPGKKLTSINVNLFYTYTYKIINHDWGRLLTILVILIVPIVNLVLAFSIFFSWYKYKKALEIYFKDKETVKRPFCRMVYAQELCERKGKIFEEMEIELSGLKQFHFNPETLKDLKDRKNDDDKVRFMIYSNTFWKYYYDFPRYSDYHTWWSIFALVYLMLGCFLQIIYIDSLI